jgi:NAD+ synthase
LRQGVDKREGVIDDATWPLPKYYGCFFSTKTMKRNYQQETERRIAFIQKALKDAGATGIVFGNSGGKDCALVGILCKMACPDTVGLIMPCGSQRNYNEDKTDAQEVARLFDISTRVIDLTPLKESYLALLAAQTNLSKMAISNLAPRIRMTTLYAVAASENRLVAGTGNRSEIYMGYFTKWGDGGHDFNPIADLTATEVYEFLSYLKVPEAIINKAPSAGLVDGQTDEQDMGITYKAIDTFLLEGVATEADKAIMERYHRVSAHKRRLPLRYDADNPLPLRH